METVITAAMERIAHLLPTNEIDSSSEQTLRDRQSLQSQNVASTLQNLGTTFRETLFRMDESHHPAVEQMTKAAEWFVRKLRGPEQREHTLVLSGSTGCGKTHIARKIKAFSDSYGVDIILSKRIFHWSSCWIDWPRIAEADDEEDFLEMVRRIDESTLVILDDVGSESDRFKNGVPASRLRRILTECKRKWLVMTCNFGMQQMLDKYDARVADRFQAFQWVEVGAVPSYRPKLAQQ